MQQESNCTETYQYLCSGSKFQFTTIQDIVVTVDIPQDPRFFPDNPELPHAHSFFIETSNPSKGLDIRLRNTVLNILVNFLKENDAIIIYYCDPIDGRGDARHAKFNRWYSAIRDPSIEKQDRQVIVKDLKVDENENLVRTDLAVYASILLRKSHPNYDAVLRLFHSGDIDKSGKL